ERPAAAAGVFTTNRVKAAPVLVAQERVRRGRLQAIAVNSGSANCFTGRAGIKLAQDSCAALAAGIGCAAEAVAPCSTGVIGHLYELEKYRAGIRHAIGALSADGLDDFARAIMTTDTRPKTASAQLRLGGAEVTIAGCAKGAGMIEPKMATMLAFIVTDAAVRAPELKRTLAHALPSGMSSQAATSPPSTRRQPRSLRCSRASWCATAKARPSSSRSRCGARAVLPTRSGSRARSPTRRWSRRRSSDAIRSSGES